MNAYNFVRIIVVLSVPFLDRDPHPADQHVVDRRALRPPGVQFSELLGLDCAVSETRSRPAVRGVRRYPCWRYCGVFQLASTFQGTPRQFTKTLRAQLPLQVPGLFEGYR